MSNQKLQKIKDPLMKKGFDLSNALFMKLDYGRPRYAVLKCSLKKNGEPVILKISPINDKEGKLVLKKEFLAHLCIYKHWLMLKKKFFYLPRPLGAGQLRLSAFENAYYFAQEYIDYDKVKVNRLVSRNYPMFVEHILKSIQSIHLRRDKAIDYYSFDRYFRECKENIELLVRAGILPKDYKVKIVNKYRQVGKNIFNRYIGVICHGDFSELNFIPTSKHFYLIDWEQVHIGSIFTDWARILLRAEMYKPVVLREMGISKTAKGVGGILGQPQLIDYFKTYFVKNYKKNMDTHQAVFDVIYLDRILWYLRLKVPRQDQPPYPKIINYFVNRLNYLIEGGSFFYD